MIDYYEPDIVSANDYYPFGMTSRVGLSSNGIHYRYGFNGKENDWEAKGWQNQEDYGERIYDPRVGRFLSVDPLTKGYPMLTPYQFASNTPIAAIDIDGEESGIPMNGIGPSGTPLSNYFDNSKGRKVWVKGLGIGTAVGGAVLVDVFVTKGALTRTILAAQVFGAFPHKPASTPEGRALQDKTSKEQLAEASIFAGGGKILGKALQGLELLLTKTKAILKAVYSYGETTITTQVGKEAVEIGRGGIGSGGYLEMEINVKVGKDGAKVASGEAVFEEIYKSAQANANTPINGVRGMWFPGQLGDNLDTFNKLIVEKVNKGLMTVEEAALQTFTGKMATKKGFTTVKSISGKQNADGTYKAVNSIIFTK